MADLFPGQTRWQKITSSLRTSLWGIGIIVSILGARALGAFQALEFMVLDRVLTMNTQLSIEAADPTITIVQLDSPYVQNPGEQGYTITADTLATVLEEIFQDEPAVVGADIVAHRIIGNNQENLLSIINQRPNLITVENSNPNIAKPIQGLSQQQLDTQVGFNDLIFDREVIVRRALLGFFPPAQPDSFKLSFPIQTVRGYVKQINTKADQKISKLENGTKDPDAMRFGQLEIPRLSNAYGYTDKQLYGTQTLINYRGQAEPFKIIRASELLGSQAKRNELIKNRIVLLHLENLSTEFATPLTRVFKSRLSDVKVVRGIEIQAHIISQIIQGIENRRPLIWTTPIAQYVFLIVCSLIVIAASRLSRDILGGFSGLLLTVSLSSILSYVLLLQMGLWLPLAATLVSVTANGLIYINYTENKRRWERLIAERDLALENERHVSEKLASERQKTIENVFDSIHNGPLQTLANLLRQTRDETINLPDICFSLEDLNREIRYIGDSIKQDVSSQKDNLDVSYAGTKFDLNIPLQELFQEVYDAMLSRSLIGFSNLKFTIISFDSVESESLNTDVKRKLCRFLEEALGNVGKHAIGATRLVVTGKYNDNHYELTIADNGSSIGLDTLEPGEGTRIGEEVSNLTQGSFIHRPNKPNGFFCQLTFPI